ncbi:MAG TPA: winged helix-turn-helix domain-containing protein, partial [Acetobacteraceae bacterium]
MDAPVAGETLGFEGWRFDMRAGDLLRQDPEGGWTPVAIGTRARDILALLLQRPGALVSKDAIMGAVWPNVAVEPNNLTVQIAALRRTLDEGRAGGSCIETVPGRGYRFIPRVTHQSETQAEPPPAPVAESKALPARVRRLPSRPRLWSVAGSCAVAMAALLAVAVWQGGWRTGQPAPPRLSLVVLPFQNLSGDAKDDYLADGVTDDLTTELSHIPD